MLTGISLSRGAYRIFQVLYGLAVRTAHQRRYAVLPASVTMHLPQQLLARDVGYTPRHLRRLLPELVKAGLLDWGAHATKVHDMGLWDGCLWAVKIRPTELVPQLRRDEWRHPWRDFAGDMAVGRTVKAFEAAVSHLHPEAQKEAVKDALDAWTVIPGNLTPPVVRSSDMEGEKEAKTPLNVTQVAYRLGELNTVHPTRRAGLIGRLGSALSQALGDPQSRRWYCAVMWQAWRDQVEGRAGLQVLGAALLRLQADLREWPALRNPAALLVVRLRSG